MRVLVVAAHPDDEVIGCGATIARLADEGSRVTVLLPTRRCDPRGRATWDDLLAGFDAACGLLGATARVADTLIDETRAEPAVHELHDAVAPYVEDADWVLTHWPGDVNQVHRGVARAVEIATRPFRRRRDVSLFEIATSTDQGFGGSGASPFSPTQYVMVSESQVRRKIAAMERYPHELASGRTGADLERRMRSRGAEIGAEYAEAFVVARQFV